MNPLEVPGGNSCQRPKVAVAFDWLFRPWKLLTSPHEITAYLSAAGCFYGAVLFLIAVCAACVPTVSCKQRLG